MVTHSVGDGFVRKPAPLNVHARRRIRNGTYVGGEFMRSIDCNYGNAMV